MPRADALFELDDPVLQPETSLDRSLEPSLEACDESLDDSLVAPGGPACPPALLREFVKLMAAHGRDIRPELMLLDREYAMWQLARARTAHDSVLHRVAAQVFAYLDARPLGAGVAPDSTDLDERRRQGG
jgi:hypothetical protein